MRDMHASNRIHTCIRMGISVVLVLIVTASFAAERYKVGMVADVGRYDDAGFNQSCKEGLERAMVRLKLYASFKKTKGRKDFEKKLNDLIRRDYDLIIGVGYMAKDALVKQAAAHPEQQFVLVDAALHPVPTNVQTITFQVDQVAFLAGYLAAAWADMVDPDNPQVGYVAGERIPTVEQFVVAYENGVGWYNRQKKRMVECKGDYVDTFNAKSKGKQAGKQLIDDGVDVIFGVGGQTGNGALVAAKESGKYGVGVDTDQYYTLVDEQDIILTSCMKKLDNAIYSVVKSACNGHFKGGSAYVGTLSNRGVGMASFHAFSDRIPEELKEELMDIKKKIKHGELSTGWIPENDMTTSAD